MANSLNALLLQFLLMFLAAILFASLIYFVEQGEWDDEQGLWIYPEGSSTADGEASAFTSIVKGLWWCITTITTVGYGDMFPRTPGGKLVAICTFGAGLLSIAVPVAVVASNFSEQYEERKTNWVTPQTPHLTPHVPLYRYEERKTATVDEAEERRAQGLFVRGVALGVSR